jgi:hypothetical protein
MSSKTASRWIPCLVLAIASLAGCRGDRGPERVIVSGAATYKGKPVASGTIRFVPLEGTLPAAAANIIDGKYTVDNRGGVPVGTHRIEIEAYRAIANSAAPSADTGRRSQFEQYVPKRYNVDSQLQITIPPSSKPITKDFDLTD